jgi:aromatic ring hydroxylase
MKRTERTPLQRAVDDVLSTAMAMAHQMRTKQPYDELQKKFLRACNKLQKRKNWNR